MPTSAVLAEPSRPKRLVTALPRVRARYALYTTANMTDHWKTARCSLFCLYSCDASSVPPLSEETASRKSGSVYLTLTSSPVSSSSAPRESGIPRVSDVFWPVDGDEARRMERRLKGTGSSLTARSASRR